MKINRRTELRRETHELIVIVKERAYDSHFCEICQEEVMHQRVAQAAISLSLPETAVFRLAESGQIHSAETPRGALMLCSKAIAFLVKELSNDRDK